MQPFVYINVSNLQKKALKVWNWEHFGICHEEVKALINELSRIQNSSVEPMGLQAEKDLENKIANKWQRLESIWRQKSRELWLNQGDKCSKFFFASTMVRQKRNNIVGIKKDDGQWITKRQDIREYLIQNFSVLFQSSNPSIGNEIFQLFEPIVTDEQNAHLLSTPSSEEVKNTLWMMHPLKAPGPDGMPGTFFRNYWDIVGDQVISFVQNFFRDKHMLKAINFTNIMLIPKSMGTTSFNNFHPISLYNLGYKLISKIIANRL